MTQFPLLSALIWLPILSGVLVLMLKHQPTLAKQFSLWSSIGVFILSLGLYTGFDATTAQMQFVEQASWIAVFNIQYFLGVDGISMPLIILTTFTTVLAVWSAFDCIKDRIEQYMAAFLMMNGIMVAVFQP